MVDPCRSIGRQPAAPGPRPGGRPRPWLGFRLARVRAAWLLAVLALTALGTAVMPGPAGAEPGETRGPYLWVKTVEGDFAEIVETARTALSVANFPVSNVRDYRESFTRRFEQLGGKRTLPFAHYRILDFCNVMYAIRQLSTDLRMGVFMPCKLVIYQGEQGGDITLMTVNPDFMHQVMDNPELKPVVRELEKTIRAVFDSVDF